MGPFGNNTIDDLDSFQKAVDFLSSRNGGRLYVPNGNYLFKDNNITGVSQKGLVIKSSNIDIEFESESARIVTDKTKLMKGISVTSSVDVSSPVSVISNINIFGGTIDGESDISGSIVQESAHGIDIRRATNVSIQNMHIENFRGDGIYVAYGSEDILISNNFIDGKGKQSKSGVRQGISVLSGKNIQIINNRIIDTLIGVDIESDDNQISNGYNEIQRIIISKNIISDCSSEGIAVVTPLVSSPVRLEDIIITHNTLTNIDETLIEVDIDTSAGIAKRVIVSGNTSDGSNTFKGILFKRVQEGTISENHLVNNESIGIQIATGCSNIGISGNVIHSKNDDGIRIQENFATSRNRGIVIGSGNRVSTDNNGAGLKIEGAWDVSIEGGIFYGAEAGISVIGAGPGGVDTDAVLTINGGVFVATAPGGKGGIFGADIALISSSESRFSSPSTESFSIVVTSSFTRTLRLSHPILELAGTFFSDSRNGIQNLSTSAISLVDAFEFQNSSADLNNINSFANKVGKQKGVSVFNTTTNKRVQAMSSAPNAAWVNMDGTVEHSPS